MATPPLVALAFLLGALPVCVWAGYTDLSRMRIPNLSVILLVGVFAVVGLALLPLEGWTFSDWAWRWAQLVAVLALGMILNAIWLLGAGDAKLAAAAAPFVALADWRPFLSIFLASMLICWFFHRMAMVTVGRRLAPDWVSWSSGKRFPMGVVFGTALLAYLAFAAAA
jgi:prepilin peptidase CpaA